METDLNSIKRDLRVAFLKALTQGTKEPLRQYKQQINRALYKLTYIGTIDNEKLKTAIEDRTPTTAPAEAILDAARITSLRAIPANRPDFKETIGNLRKAQKLTEQLNIDYRAYTPKTNAKHIVGFSLAGSFLLAATMAAVDFLDKTTLSLSSDGLIFSCIIGATAGAIGAVRHNNEYYKHSKRGLRHIRKAFK